MENLEELNEFLREMKKRVNQEAASRLKKYRGKANKMISDTDKWLHMIKEDGENFKENITPDSSARMKYSQKIYELLNENMARIEIPEIITRDSLESFAKVTRDVLHEQDEQLIKFIRLLKDKNFLKRVKTLSKSLQRLNKDLTRLENFIGSEYVPNSGIEVVENNLDEIFENIENYNEIMQRLLQKESEILEKDEEILKIEQEIIKLESNATLLDLEHTREEFSQLQRDLDIKYSNIRKVLRTQVNILSKSKEGGDTTLMKEFITDVATTMAGQMSIGGLTDMFTLLDDNMANGKLKLKKDKREVAREDIAKYKNRELEEDWKKSRELFLHRGELTRKLEKLELEKQIEKLRSQKKAAFRDRNRVFERELRDLNQSIDEISKIYAHLQKDDIYPIDLPDEIPFEKLPIWINNKEIA